MPLSFSFEAIGTHWDIEFYDEGLSEVQLISLRRQIERRIALYDKTYSRFRDDSLVAEMGRQAGRYTLPEDGHELFDLYREVYELSEGAVTPLIGQVMVDAGYDAAYSLRPGEMHRPKPWNEVLDYVFPTLELKEPAVLDVGAAGKGQLVDIVGALIESHGCREYLIDAGGDMRHRGPETLEIGLEHPSVINQVIGIAPLRGRSLCGSAGNRRSWADMHHIIDPRTLQPAKAIKAVWVVADTTLLADMMATALFFTPAVTLKKRYTFEYAVLYEDYSLEYSKGFDADFYTES